jgi:RNA polymerase sigma-70 factor (ECF subfamily)
MDADPTDDDLAARAARRDRAAFDRLIDRHDRPLTACLLRRLGRPDAEEVLQDVLLRAWRAAGSYKGGNYRAWLFQIARTGMTDWVRRHVGSTADPRETDGPAADHAAAVEHCLGTLDDRERELLRARFGGAEDLPAACARLGIETKTGQNLVSPALARLRECVETRSRA